MSHSCRTAGGFSLLELVVATSLLLVVMASVFQLLQPAQGAFAAEPERTDMQQRTRLAVDTLSAALTNAGAGSTTNTGSGALTGLFPPVLPFRQGRRNSDTPGAFKSDTITLLQVTAVASQTTIAQPLPASSGSVMVNVDPGCPVGDLACGLQTDASVLVFDDSGRYGTFSIADVSGSTLTLQHNLRDSSYVYPSGITRLVEASSETFYLKSDRRADLFQLMRYDGAGGPDVPVLDHVVGLSFEYLGDPDPPRMIRSRSDLRGPWTTYGPPPPAVGIQTTLYPPGENCVFTDDGSATPAPRLAVLGGTGLAPLGRAQLVDGPWCPDAADPNRFDADLLRVRAVRVAVKVESAMAALRGPAGPLFTRGGTARGGSKFVPDHETRFEIAPRNLAPGR